MTPSTARDSRTLRHSFEALARGRYLMPVVLALGVSALIVNEVSYQHSRRTLTVGIALTEARMQVASTLQLLTDAGQYARAYILSGSPDDAVAYRAAVENVHAVKQKAFDLVAQVDPKRRVSVDTVERLVNELIRSTDEWVMLVAQGDTIAALPDAVSRESRERRDRLRDEFGKVLHNAAGIQEGARFSLYNALSMSRFAVHLLALAAVLSMFMFRRQLRFGDEQLAKEQSLLADRVRDRTAELTEMATHLVHAREDERAHIARELHDEMGGLLTAMKLDFARLRRLPDMPGNAKERMASIETRLNEGIALKRRIIENLRPSSLEQLGLVPALEILCNDMSSALNKPIRADLQPVQVEKNAELTLYRIAQESLTNACKYAHCSHVEVQLKKTGLSVCLRVQDDGRGFDPQQVGHGRHGLIGMRVRVESHGGRLSVKSTPGQGTTIEATLPVAETRLESADIAQS